MNRLLVVVCLALIICSSPLLAADNNFDGLDDSYISMSVSPTLVVGDVAVVDAGSSVDLFVERITSLGYTVSVIPTDTPLETMMTYSVIILPVSHASSSFYSTMDGRASDFLAYVNGGGGLWVEQPNPYDMAGGEADISWVPYQLTLASSYSTADCPSVVNDPTHCITEGMGGANFSTAGDTTLSRDPEWQVLCSGNATGAPSVMFAGYGEGKVLVELGHISQNSLCPFDDVVIHRYLDCLASGSVATSPTTLEGLKAFYR